MNIYVFSLLCCILFLSFKIINNKYIKKKNNLDIKPIIKDCILIFITIIIVDFLYNKYLNHHKITNDITVFTDNPNF